MKIEQKKEFKPLTITLETRREYDAFFVIVDRYSGHGNPEY